MIRCITCQKSGIMFFPHNYARIKTDSFDSSPLTMILHNAIILIESVFNKNKTCYYYTILLEKC